MAISRAASDRSAATARVLSVLLSTDTATHPLPVHRSRKLAPLGNILTDDFSAIWNNEICKKLRSMSEDEALACPFRQGKEARNG